MREYRKFIGEAEEVIRTYSVSELSPKNGCLAREMRWAGQGQGSLAQTRTLLREVTITRCL